MFTANLTKSQSHSSLSYPVNLIHSLLTANLTDNQPLFCITQPLATLKYPMYSSLRMKQPAKNI